MSVSHHHADWLSLVEASGPFVSLPVLLRVFPQGLEPRDPAQAKALRSAYEEWHNNPVAPGKHRAWLLYVLTAVLGYPQSQMTEDQAIPAGLEANMPEMGETLRPDFALVGPEGSDTAGQAKLLIASYSSEQALDRPVTGKHWKATPATRMMELLHGTGVPLGLVTNGEQWMLVYAPRGETTGYASWYGALWLDEPITLRAFHSLLGVRRFFGVAIDSTLLALLKESAQDQQEVTDQLGYQVREAVEVLVQSFDAIDKESHRRLFKGVRETALYEAALTIMMRLVFLFSAEERGLLHLGEPLYDENYAVSTLQEQLQEVADRYGEEVLERRMDAWARLLATFRAVHGGIRHQDLLMQAYGGSLFDPDRYPFLEGRAAGTVWQTSAGDPLAVNNRVVLHLLNSLQRLRTKVGTGGITETRRVSFRALGVEQIGHVYEGLLDHTAVRASEPVIGIKGTRSKEPEILLSTLEAFNDQGSQKLIEFLKDETGRSVPALQRAMDEGGLLDEHKLLVACNQDEQLLKRLRPFAGIIREDSFGRPLVVLEGSVYVTSGTTRRSTGTHYTPPSLTEPIVQYTLEPLVYVGPVEGSPKDEWRLKKPKAILELKVCDMAMGSGAFLVQACRYLAERLVEAWENEEKQHPGEVLITPDGKFSGGSPSERLIPEDINERIAIARRVVADRCLYGVDINSMAVEMAKLSLWLITVDAHRPFTFLDHAFKCGDSLLGITSLKQLENFSLRSDVSKQQSFSTPNLRQYIEDAKGKREALEAMPSDTPEQIAAKAALYLESEEAVAKLSAVADVLVALELRGLKGRAYDAEREHLADLMMGYWGKSLQELQAYASKCLSGRSSFHWTLAFPEIMESGGFDAFLGNPPFIGGSRISSALGASYLLFLQSNYNSKARADFCCYFFLRGFQLSKTPGCLGLIATNTIAQADSREASLANIIDSGGVIIHASPSHTWPGAAAVFVSLVHVFKGKYNGVRTLKNIPVEEITSFLDSGFLEKHPIVLQSQLNKTFHGSVLVGNGFILTKEEVEYLFDKNVKNAEVLFPYINGMDINTTPNQRPTRWVVNFFDWPLNRESAPDGYSGKVAEDFPEVLDIIRNRVKPGRDELGLKSDSSAKGYARLWWQYGRRQEALYSRIRDRDFVIARPRVSNTHAPAFISTEVVFSDAVVVFILDTLGEWAVLQSNLHEEWARKYCSTMKQDLRYSATDAFENFPFPTSSCGLNAVGENYYNFRRSVLNENQIGLTSLYKRFHDQNEKSEEFAQLRVLHKNLDETVATSYGWQNIDLGHDFHETKQGVRYTISEAARREVLNRLLALNYLRHAEEEAELATKPTAALTKRGRKKKEPDDQMTMDL